jgi:hypothetical protein
LSAWLRTFQGKTLTSFSMLRGLGAGKPMITLKNYVTSVDTIYLLESLVAVRFTVEEKNRIRRNLEGLP